MKTFFYRTPLVAASVPFFKKTLHVEPDRYLAPLQISMIKLFYLKSKWLKAVYYFHPKLHQRYLIKSWILFRNLFAFRLGRSSQRGCSMKKYVLKNLAKFAEKHLRSSLFFNKVAGLMPATLLKKRLQHRCFPVNFAKFLRTPFLQNTSRCVLLIGILPCHWILFFPEICSQYFVLIHCIILLLPEAYSEPCQRRSSILDV